MPDIEILKETRIRIEFANRLIHKIYKKYYKSDINLATDIIALIQNELGDKDGKENNKDR